MNLDTHCFEELDDINDGELEEGLWQVVWTFFQKRKSRERALDGAGRIVDLYTQPIGDDFYRGIPRQSADHYRTREELIRVSRSPRLVNSMMEYGLLELHPHWPSEWRDHPQAPYRPIVSAFARVRATALREEECREILH